MRLLLSTSITMTITQATATTAASVAGMMFGDERNDCTSSCVIAFVHATGFFLNSGQLRFSSPLKNATWIASRLIKGRLSIIVS
jgi:hypothetical protein